MEGTINQPLLESTQRLPFPIFREAQPVVEEEEREEKEEEEGEEKEGKINFCCDLCGFQLQKKPKEEVIVCSKCKELTIFGLLRAPHTGFSSRILYLKQISYTRCPCGCLIVNRYSENVVLGYCPRCQRVLLVGDIKKKHFYCLCSLCGSVLVYECSKSKQKPFEMYCRNCQTTVFIRRKNGWWLMLSCGISLLLGGSIFFAVGILLRSLSLFVAIFLPLMGVGLFLFGVSSLFATVPYICKEEAVHFTFEEESVSSFLGNMSQEIGFKSSLKGSVRSVGDLV